MTTGDEIMNRRILERLGRTDAYSKDNLSRMYLKSTKSLVGIEGAERDFIQKALVEFQGNKSAFVDFMETKYDRSPAEWGNLYSNELHVADGAADQIRAGMQGATTKTWATHPESSTSGPCPDCEAMEGETVGIDEAYSNGDQIPGQNHPGCVCGEAYGKE